MSHREFSDFCSNYLDSWNKRATIRSLNRFRLNSVDSASDVYPTSKQPLANHPLIKELGEPGLYKLMVLSSYQVMQAVAGIEVVVVTDICSKIATEDCQVELPKHARQVALTVATDESYHSFVANEFIEDLERVSGVQAIDFGPQRLGEIPIVNAVRKFRQAVPKAHQPIADLVAVCFAENFLTEDLYDLSRNSQKDSVFQRIIREHIMDEGRHQLFFKRLLSYCWAQFNAEQKSCIGNALPLFLDNFLMDLEKMEGRDMELVVGLGFDQATAKRIVSDIHNDTLESWKGYKGAFSHAHPSYELLHHCGILDDATAYKALKRASWVP